MEGQLDANGVDVARGACAASTCSALLAEIHSGLKLMLALPQAMSESVRPPSKRHILPISLSPTEVILDPVYHRRDFKLPFSPVTDRVIRTLLSGDVGNILLQTLGPDAELFELTTITSEPGSAAQPMHSDGMWSATLPRIITVFLALHDVLDERMGPTRFCLMTHVPRCFPDGRWMPPTEANVAEERQVWFRLQAGDAVLMDSTTWHCGGANTSDQRRTLLAASFRPFDTANETQKLSDQLLRVSDFVEA